MEEAAARGCDVVSLQRNKSTIEYIESFVTSIDSTQLPEESEPEDGNKTTSEVTEDHGKSKPKEKKKRKDYPIRSKKNKDQ